MTSHRNPQRPRRSWRGYRNGNNYELNAAKTIDAAFTRPVKISYRGKPFVVSTFFAIYYQLAQKAPTDRRALRVLSRYTAYAKQKGGIGQVRCLFQGKRS